MCFTSFKRIQAKQVLCDLDNFVVIISAKPPTTLYYASVNSSSAHPPPGQTPGISIFFFKWQIPGGGDKQVRQMPRVGTKKDGKCPTPEII